MEIGEAKKDGDDDPDIGKINLLKEEGGG